MHNEFTAIIERDGEWYVSPDPTKTDHPLGCQGYT